MPILRVGHIYENEENNVYTDGPCSGDDQYRPTSTDAPWDQPENYKGYHVWVENTSSLPMRVTLFHPDGTYEQAWVAKDSNRIVFQTSNAAPGRYRVGFYVEDGNKTGTVSVRVSEA